MWEEPIERYASCKPLSRKIAPSKNSQTRFYAAFLAVRDVWFAVNKVALEQGFLRVFRFSSVIIIPPLLHIHPCIIWGIDKGAR
jgi:hypothetical protein